MGKAKPKDWATGRWLIESMDLAQGRGWLILEDEELKGMFLFHQGDESGVVLKREPEKKPRKRK